MIKSPPVAPPTSSASANAKSAQPQPPLNPKSAWAKGPPLHSRSNSVSQSRSQSPAPNQNTSTSGNAPNANANANAGGAPQVQHTHSRRPSALGGAVPIKDGVSVPRGNLGAAKQGAAINFGSVNEQHQQSTAASSNNTPSQGKSGGPGGTGAAEPRQVQSFGSISAQPTRTGTPAGGKTNVNGKQTSSGATTNGTSTPSTSSTTTNGGTPSASTTTFDVRALFRGGGTPAPPSSGPPSTSSSVSTASTTSAASNASTVTTTGTAIFSSPSNTSISSPSMRSAGLPHQHPGHPSHQHHPAHLPHHPGHHQPHQQHLPQHAQHPHHIHPNGPHHPGMPPPSSHSHGGPIPVPVHVPSPHFGQFPNMPGTPGTPSGAMSGGPGGPGGPQIPGNPPRSPNYTRGMANGTPASGGRGNGSQAGPPGSGAASISAGSSSSASGPSPPNSTTPSTNSTTTANSNASSAPGAMSSPRLGPPQHPGHPQQHPHAHMQMHGQPMQVIPGAGGVVGVPGGVNIPGGMPQPFQVPGWPAAYYYPQYSPYAPMHSEHYLPPGYTWQIPPQHGHQHPGQGPPTPHAPAHGLPVSPRQPPPPLQPPGTPPAGAGANALSVNVNAGSGPGGPGGLMSPPGSARLNSGASAFVPSHGSRPSKVIIRDSTGQEVDFRKAASPITEKGSGVGLGERLNASPSPAEKRRPTPVRIETEEAKRKRLAEEETKAREKEEEKKRKEEEERAKKEKEVEEKKKREEEERKRIEEEAREKERLKLEEEERIRKAEEEKKKKEEEERIRKEKLEEEERQKERLRLEEEQRLRKEEEEKLRKVEEEKKQKEEEERLKGEEEERIRKEKEIEELDRVKMEEEKRALDAAAEEAIKTQERMADSQLETVAEVESEKPDDLVNVLNATPAASLPPQSDSHKRRPIPGPLDLSSTNRMIPQPLSSALATARHIQDLSQVSYPEGVRSPKPELNANAKDGKFRYDRDFLMQFMKVCNEKPENIPPLECISDNKENMSAHPMSRGGSGRGRNASAGPSTFNLQRQPSIGLGITSSGKISGPMGQFATMGKMGDERFRSASSGNVPAGLPFPAGAGGRPVPLGRTPSQGGPNGAPGGSLNKRTRSKRGESRNEANRVNSSGAPSGNNSQSNNYQSNYQSNYGLPTIPGMEPVAPLEQSANRWVPLSTKRAPAAADQDSPEVIDRKVRALLNKLSMEKFDSISNQIIVWANKSEKEKDGRTLIQVIRLVFEKATDEANWSEMYARLCRKMMDLISPNVQDESIKNSEGKPIAGGLLFRKYLLNRCQEDFERGWSVKESTAAAAAAKAGEDRAAREAAEKDKDGEAILYSEEYYAAQKAKRQGLGLVKFIGELFKLQMLTERIMHECIKKALSNVDDPEEEEIESLCKLLTTVGKLLDTSKAHAHMDVYFARIKELARSHNVTSRMQFMLQDVIELRERNWIPRNLAAAPSTIAQVHEAAAKEKAQQEKDSYNRSSTMSRGGSRRGGDRNDYGPGGPQQGDGWTATRASTKAGDLSNFGKINKPSTVNMNFAPVNVFSKKDAVKGREASSLSRTSSSSNMYSLLEHTDAANAAAANAGQGGMHPPTGVHGASGLRPSRPPSRMASVDLTHAGGDTNASAPAERPRLMLHKRTLPIPSDVKDEANADTPAASRSASRSGTPDEDEELEEGEVREGEDDDDDDAEMQPPVDMSDEEVDKKIKGDIAEFFAIRNMEEADVYFPTLPVDKRHKLVDKLVLTAIEKKEADAQLVANLFERVANKNLCTMEEFEKGFVQTAEFLDDIAIDAPKAIDLMAIMMKGAKLDEETKGRIVGKSAESGERLLELVNKG